MAQGRIALGKLRVRGSPTASLILSMIRMYDRVLIRTGVGHGDDKSS